MLELVPGNPEQVNENQEIYLNILLIMCAKSAKGGFNNTRQNQKKRISSRS